MSDLVSLHSSVSRLQYSQARQKYETMYSKTTPVARPSLEDSAAEEFFDCIEAEQPTLVAAAPSGDCGSGDRHDGTPSLRLRVSLVDKLSLVLYDDRPMRAPGGTITAHDGFSLNLTLFDVALALHQTAGSGASEIQFRASRCQLSKVQEEVTADVEQSVLELVSITTDEEHAPAPALQMSVHTADEASIRARPKLQVRIGLERLRTRADVAFLQHWGNLMVIAMPPSTAAVTEPDSDSVVYSAEIRALVVTLPSDGALTQPAGELLTKHISQDEYGDRRWQPFSMAVHEEHQLMNGGIDHSESSACGLEISIDSIAASGELHCDGRRTLRADFNRIGAALYVSPKTHLPVHSAFSRGPVSLHFLRTDRGCLSYDSEGSSDRHDRRPCHVPSGPWANATNCKFWEPTEDGCVTMNVLARGPLLSNGDAVLVC